MAASKAAEKYVESRKHPVRLPQKSRPSKQSRSSFEMATLLVKSGIHPSAVVLPCANVVHLLRFRLVLFTCGVEHELCVQLLGS